MAFLGFSIVCFVGGLTALHSNKKALYFYALIFPFNFFVPIAGKNLNSTETVFLIITVVYIFKKIYSSQTFIKKNKSIVCFFLFFVTSFFTLFFNSFTAFTFIRYYRIFLFLSLIYLFYSTLKSQLDWRHVTTNIRRGFWIMSGILTIEWCYYYIISSTPSFGASRWKLFLMTIGLYPQTAQDMQIISWSSLGSMVGVFPIQHALGIYLGAIYFFFLSKILARKKKISIKDYTGIFLSLFFLMYSLSRTSILAVILGSLIVIAFRYKLKLKIVLVSLFCLALTFLYIVLPGAITNRIFTAPKALYTATALVSQGQFETDKLMKIDPSTAIRLKYEINSIEIIMKNLWIGSGNEGFKRKHNRSNPHSTLLAETQFKGILPVFFLVLFFGYSFANVRKLIRIYGFNRGNIWSMGSIAFFVIVSFGSNILGDLRGMTLLLIPIAFSESILRTHKMLTNSGKKK
jgi:hypothetical protein